MIYLFERCTRPFVVLDMLMDSLRVGIVGAKIQGCKNIHITIFRYYMYVCMLCIHVNTWVSGHTVGTLLRCHFRVMNNS